MNYEAFLEAKRHTGLMSGFDPLFMPDFLFPFQKHLTTWAIQKGRAAIFADCGLGKTPMQLVWAQNVVEKMCKPVLILAPLAVGAQHVREAGKFHIEAAQSRDGTIAAPITITNYQQLHKFDPAKFGGVACDESSILKNVDGAIKAHVTDFMKRLPYRSLWTATAAPNDYIELGTSSEALGDLGFMDVLSRFFKKAEATTSRSDEFRSGVYRFRGHAEEQFWRWVCSWARAVRMPSDLGFSDDGYILPPLESVEHIVRASSRRDGWLIDMPAITLQEQREERRRTIQERCEAAAALICAHGKPAVAWGSLNDECDLMEKMIPGCVNIEGKDSDEFKEEMLTAFAAGQIRVITTKAQIAGFGLNWTHCAHQTFFPSHSFEQWYQSIRRSWRFGQKNPVRVDIVSSEGEAGVIANLNRKQRQAETMFRKLVELMGSELKIEQNNQHTNPQEIPEWLS